METAEFRKACLGGDLAGARAGLAAGCDASAVNAKGMTPLMLAVWQQDAVDLVAALLAAGADVAAHQPSSGWTAATFAAVGGRIESLRLLLEHGASVVGDWKALHFAVQYRSRDTVPLLLAAGADVNARDEERRTALMRAARNADALLVRLLLEHGADASLSDTDGWGALHFAATRANVPNLQALRAAGADPDAAAHDGTTPRGLAEDAGRPKVIATLG